MEAALSDHGGEKRESGASRRKPVVNRQLSVSFLERDVYPRGANHTSASHHLLLPLVFTLFCTKFHPRMKIFVFPTTTRRLKPQKKKRLGEFSLIGGRRCASESATSVSEAPFGVGTFRQCAIADVLVDSVVLLCSWVLRPPRTELDFEAPPLVLSFRLMRRPVTALRGCAALFGCCELRAPPSRKRSSLIVLQWMIGPWLWSVGGTERTLFLFGSCVEFCAQRATGCSAALFRSVPRVTSSSNRPVCRLAPS